jgi:hypothetical protein
VNDLFENSQATLVAMSTKIKTGKEAKIKNGEYPGGCIPYLCDIEVIVEDEDKYILRQLHATCDTRSGNKHKKNYQLIYPDRSELVKAPPHTGNKNIDITRKYLLTSDKNRLDSTRWLVSKFLSLKNKEINYTAIAKELNNLYPDTYGFGWCGGRIKSLMLNTLLYGVASFGKTCNRNKPTLTLRSKTDKSGYTYHIDGDTDLTGTDNVIQTPVMFDFIPKETCDTIKEIIYNFDKVKPPRKFLKQNSHYLKGLVIDSICNCELRYRSCVKEKPTYNAFYCVNSQKKHVGYNKTGCGCFVSAKPLDLIVNEYMKLCAYKENREAHKMVILDKIQQDMLVVIKNNLSKQTINELLKKENGEFYEEAYQLARNKTIDKDNLDIDLRIENVKYAIEECKDKEGIQILVKQLNTLIKSKQPTENLLPRYIQLKKDFYKNCFDIIKVANGGYDSSGVRNFMLINKIFVNVTAKSTINISSQLEGFPTLDITWNEYRTKFCMLGINPYNKEKIIKNLSLIKYPLYDIQPILK